MNEEFEGIHCVIRCDRRALTQPTAEFRASLDAELEAVRRDLIQERLKWLADNGASAA